jgi:hypothetical protein
MGALFIGLLMGGCDAPKPAQPEPTPPAPSIRTSFDPSTARTIAGRLTWNGATPRAPAFEIMPNPLSGVILQQRQQRPNPNLPTIDPATHGLAGAVVFLRGVDPARAKPWDLPAVCVEQRDCQIRISQGSESWQIGFVHNGDEIVMVSRDPWLHALHVGGAAYFTLMFPDPDQPIRRKLNTSGLIELSSNVGYFWMRGYLFVDEHPYFCRTDRHGRFTLAGVPPGAYRLVAWLPNWKVARQERDPESGLVSRISFGAPLEIETPINVAHEDSTDIVLRLSEQIIDGR